MSKKRKRPKMNIFGNTSKAALICYFLGGIIVAVAALFVTSCFIKGDRTVMTFVSNLKFYASGHFVEILGNITSVYFLVTLLISEMMYICLILLYKMKPNKYMWGKEYGSAEWGDVYAVNEFLSSSDPPEEFKVYYKPERKVKRFVRKLFENRKKYIK